MKKQLFIFCFLLSNVFLHAQILDLNQPIFTDEPFFNQTFVKTNRIKSIKGSISSKKVQDIIRSKGLDYYYEFNDDGTLLMQLASHYSKGLKDSSIITYCYNEQGYISIKRKSDSYGYYSHHYKYNDDGNVVLQTYCRDENRFECKSKFELKKQYTIVADSFSYEQLSNKQIKKKFYNNTGRVFKEQTNYYNDLGYIIEEYTKYLIGNKKKKFTYEYDEIGRLKAKHTYVNIAENKKKTEYFTYDKIGNILDIKVYENDKYLTRKQFLYNNETMLLTAQIIQDIETGFLSIIQYSYSFFGDNEFVEIQPLDSTITQ